MATFSPLSRLFPTLAISLTLLTIPIHAQIQSPCTASMITNFAPCVNFVTNSTSTGTSPTSDCCNSLRSMTSNGTECMCSIATGSVPFQIPINRTLAISLPRACNMASVPLQCKASAAPIPAPGPTAFSPSLSPEASAPPTPQASSVPTQVSPALSPEADTTPALTPPSTTVASQAPTSNSGSRPVVTPSAAGPALSFSPALFLTLFGAMALKCYY